MRGVNVNMFYDDLNTEEQVSYLIKPILQVLQEAGGQLERSEIRDRISELDEHIAEFEQNYIHLIKQEISTKNLILSLILLLKSLVMSDSYLM